MALRDVHFLVADDDLAEEDLLVGRPVLSHMGIDSTTMLVRHREELDGLSCADVRNVVTTRTGKIGRLLLARIHHVKGACQEEKKNQPTKKNFNKLNQSGDRKKNRQTSNYFTNRNEIDPFPHPSLIDPNDLDQEDDIKTGINGMLQDATRNGFPATYFDKLSNMIWQRKNVFRTTFSAGPPAAVPPLRIKLRADAVPTILKLRKYTHERKLFLRRLMKKSSIWITFTQIRRRNRHQPLTCCQSPDWMVGDLPAISGL